MHKKRITIEEALEIYRSSSIHELGRRAGEIAGKLHPGNIRTYIIERNINYTNVCQVRCSFCAFSVSPSNQSGYVLAPSQLRDKILPLIDLGGTQILLQGGLNPNLPFAWYEELLSRIKQDFPQLQIHGFSPPEIIFLSRKFNLAISEVLTRLRRAGLDTIPGGGAEILSDRVRKIIAPAKCTAEEWIEVMRQAHRTGIVTTATMMFGHVETLRERIEHLDKIRRLQDEALDNQKKDPSAGRFTAFTCWPFQPGTTRLGRLLTMSKGQSGAISSPNFVDCPDTTSCCQAEPGASPSKQGTIPPKNGNLPENGKQTATLCRKNRTKSSKPDDFGLKSGQVFPAEASFSAGYSYPHETSFPAGACEQLKMTALARIFLDNIPNIQASWVTQGPHIAQLSLSMGCNDAGSLMMEENVVSAAGTSFSLDLEALKDMIRNAGFEPVQRNGYYQVVEKRRT